MRPNWKRLIQIGSVPGWIGVIICIYRVVPHVIKNDVILPAVWNNRVIAFWHLLRTPDGNVVFATVGAAWLLGFLFWPRRSGKMRTSAQEKAVDPPSVIPNDPTSTVWENVGETYADAVEIAKPSTESWTEAEGTVVRLIPDQAGCTAILKSGQDIINARFDKTWVWYLSSLENGTTLSIEGKISSAAQTSHQLDLLDCVCPDGIRVIQKTGTRLRGLPAHDG
jgi:hypothetical protein